MGLHYLVMYQMAQTDTPIAAPSGGSRILDKKQAEAEFGGTPSWWNKVVYRKLIPYTKRGARVCFYREDVEAYFAARRVPAREVA